MNKIPKSNYRFPIKVEQVLRMKEDKVFSYDKAYKDFDYIPMHFKDGINLEVEEYIKSLKSAI